MLKCSICVLRRTVAPLSLRRASIRYLAKPRRFESRVASKRSLNTPIPQRGLSISAISLEASGGTNATLHSGYISREAAIVNQPSANPAFEARPLKSASGWYVRVAWPNGKTEHVPGFVTKQEAQRWIEDKARVWLSERCSAPEALARFATAS
jgi:hypothetical protein